MDKQQEIKIELTPEVAKGIYSNLAVITHGPNEFFVDRIIMSPENAKNLLGALMDNVKKYEQTFGPIVPKRPVGGQNGNNGEIPNPFIMGGKA